MIRSVCLLTPFIFLIQIIVAQQKLPWNGKKCAVVLTYDDGLSVHLTNAIPVLDSVGLKGTFYLSDYTGLLQSQIPQWQKAAANEHELGNHTMHHPCQGGRAGREFVQPENDLNNYTVKRITDDILSMNALLNSIDGKTERTFAYTCGDTHIRDTPYLEPIKNRFLAARGVMPAMLSPDQVKLNDVNCYSVNGQSAAELIKLVQEAKDKKGLLVFLFHGVGGGHSLNISLDVHSKLLHHLQHDQDIWNTTLLDAVKFIRKTSNKK